MLACAETTKLVKSKQEEMPANLLASWDRIVFIVNGIESTSKTFAKIRTPEQMDEYTRAQLIMIIGEIGASIKIINDLIAALKVPEIQESDDFNVETEEIMDSIEDEEIEADNKEKTTENLEKTEIIEEEQAQIAIPSVEEKQKQHSKRL